MAFSKFLCSAAVVAATFTFVAQANAFPTFGRKVVSIRNDHGGQIIDYALRMKTMERAGGHMRFAGRCDSACTLYLALPRNKTCVSRGAVFGFHLPTGASSRASQVAARYMLRNYPGWVRSWIAANGGLTHRLKTMGYAYSSRFLPACDTQIASNETKTRIR
ncbi:MAG TPA: hypothetical protein VMZ01_03095 [Aestuariivirga sp.]|nr:hypothetical protein [Aestuariivirga sp.]